MQVAENHSRLLREAIETILLTLLVFAVVKVTVQPYHIEGPVVVRDNEGRELIPPPTKVPGMVKLCGCGLSKTKPFCDGSHKR